MLQLPSSAEKAAAEGGGGWGDGDDDEDALPVAICWPNQAAVAVVAGGGGGGNEDKGGGGCSSGGRAQQLDRGWTLPFYTRSPRQGNCGPDALRADSRENCFRVPRKTQPLCGVRISTCASGVALYFMLPT